MLKLIIIDDEGRKTPVPLLRSEISIGRAEGNTIRLTERNVSREHAKLVRTDEGYRIADLSRYGVKKNGRRVDAETVFDEGDIVFIGDYRLTLVREEDTAPPEPNEATARLERREITQDLEPAEAVGALHEEGESLEESPKDEPAATEPGYADVDTEVSNRARLLCLSDPFVGSEFVFLGDVLVIGTAEDCDLIIDHPSIAAHHARFVREGGSYRVEAVGDAVVEHQGRERGALFERSDIVRLGELSFRYVEPGQAVQLVPVAAVDLDADDEGASRWPIVLAVAAALLLLVGAIVMSRPDEAAAPVAEPAEPAADDGALLLAEGQAHMREGEWDEAIAAFDGISALADEKEEARALAVRAADESEVEPTFVAARDAVDASEWQAALDALEQIPPASYYAARAADQQLERRAIDGLVNEALAASREAQEAGDLEGALAAVEALQPTAPQHRGLINRIEQLRALQSGDAEPEPEVEQEPEPAVAAAAAPSRPSRPARPSARPEPEPVVVERTPPPVPEPTQDDLRARAERADLLRRQAARSAVQQNFQDAILLLEQARELNPGDARIDLMLFSNYRQIGNANRASRAVRRYLRAQPNDPRRAELEAWLAENEPD